MLDFLRSHSQAALGRVLGVVQVVDAFKLKHCTGGGEGLFPTTKIPTQKYPKYPFPEALVGFRMAYIHLENESQLYVVPVPVRVRIILCTQCRHWGREDGTLSRVLRFMDESEWPGFITSGINLFSRTAKHLLNFGKLLFCLIETGLRAQFIAQASFERVNLLPQPLEYRDYKHVYHA